MAKEDEIREKERRVREFLERKGKGALLLTKQSNFAWFTCGGNSHVVTASAEGVVTLVVTKDKKYAVTTNIEAARIEEEELEGQGFEMISCNWHDEDKAKQITSLLPSRRVASDDGLLGTENLAEEIAELRYSLTDAEVERYHWLGKKTSECVGEVCREIEVGDTEQKIAGMLSHLLLKEGIVPIVLLIAADDRVEKYRHPIPTERDVKSYCMLVVCGRRWGLIASLTRLVAFGELPEELRAKHDAVVKIDAAFIANTYPDAVVGDIFKSGVGAYGKFGFPEEWKLHHQGGPTGYQGRDYLGRIGEERRVQMNQAVAWNPSITGTKSEDTIIATGEGREIISETPDWPMLEVEIAEIKLKRPGILIK